MINFDLEMMQWISSTALTAASVVVSAAALTIAYRKNRGWKPVLVVTGRNQNDTQNANRYTGGFDFEVWNRRPYPINVYYAELVPGNPVQGDEDAPQGWALWHGKLIFHGDVRIEPNAYSPFKPRALFERREKLIRKKYDTVRISVSYFDPARGKRLQLHAKEKLSLEVDE